jgi:hypothetical protein
MLITNKQKTKEREREREREIRCKKILFML